MPVYQLLGGKVRPGCRLYTDVMGTSLQDIEDGVRAKMEQGYQHFRLRPRRRRGGPDPFAGPNQAGGLAACENGYPTDAVFIQDAVEQFEHLRNTIGWNIELCFEVHEQPHPTGSLMMAKALEPYRPFFIEDPFAPEDVRYYEIMRQQSAVGIAMGELFVNRQEWLPLVKNRWIDYMRGHISAMGGLNIARKIAMLCEFYNVRTAWHGPGNVSPVGHCVNLHLDLALYNFGIAEAWGPFNDTLQEMFPGVPEIRDGVRYANDRPGLGVDLDEKVAAKFPLQNESSSRGARGQDCEPRRP
jgi:mannonate dehydratase